MARDSHVTGSPSELVMKSKSWVWFYFLTNKNFKTKKEWAL